ncbi:MAG: membrane dipeptidase [Deltaproteobacteria bacterium]|nr:membrane dipeptidase [Deltaproteobacteria bacterium]
MAATTNSLSDRARALHAESVVVDLHADTASLMRMGYDFLAEHRPPLPGSAFGFHVDQPRMLRGGQTAQVFGLVTFPIRKKGLFRSALHQIDLVQQAATRSNGGLTFVTEAEQIEQAKITGTTAALCGLEGVHALEGHRDNLITLATHGLRLMGLSHFSANEAAHPAKGWRSSRHAGLTEFGADLVRLCNELGVLVDLAHINRPGFFEATRLSLDPVVVSHTGVCGAHDMWRNIDDEQIRAVADTGGCIGIIYSRHFLGGSTVEALADHIVHCYDIGGEDCPALGSDFDGLIVPPRDLPDAAHLPRITEALVQRGLTDRVITKIMGGNVLRVLRSVPTKGYRPDETKTPIEV